MTSQNDKSFSILVVGVSDPDCPFLKALFKTGTNNISLSSEHKQTVDLMRYTAFRLIFWVLQGDADDETDIIKTIKQHPSSNLNTALIAVTPQTANHLAAKLLAKGFDACLTSPVQTEQLNELVNFWRYDATEPENLRCDRDDFIVQLMEKTGNNTALATVLFEKLFTDMPGQLKIIQRALAESDYALALQVAHKLHGSIVFCGFKALQPAALRLEQNLRRQNADSSRIMFQILRQQCALFLSMKRPIMQKLTQF